jgi:hypothetical protein
VSANTHKGLTLEIIMTMTPILDEGVPSFYSVWRELNKWFPMSRELLGFQKGAPEQVDMHGGTLEGFWSMIAGEAHQQINFIRDPIIQVFHSWMCKRILGRMRETKVTNTELNWLHSAFSQVAN